MFRRSLVAVLGAITLTALTLVPAQAATYAVTISAPSTGDVGALVKLTGKVTGSGAAKKTLKVQQKVSGTWKSITTVKTDSAGKYVRSVKIASVGAKYYRVVAPAQGSVKQGISPSRTVTGYTWLALVKQSFQAYGPVAADVTATVASKTYARSFLTPRSSPDDGTTLYFRPNGLCDTIAFGYGLDSRFSGTTGSPVSAAGFSLGGESYSEGYLTATSATTYQHFSGAIDPRVDLLYLSRGGGGNATTAITAPKIRCKTTALPEWDPTLAF